MFPLTGCAGWTTENRRGMVSRIRLHLPGATMDVTAYPSQFETADRFAGIARFRFHLLVAAEYAVLLTAGVIGLFGWNGGFYYAVVAFIFVLSLAIMLFRTFTTPEQDWYRARALAGAIKSSAWRFMMRCPPFNKPDKDAESAYRKALMHLVDQHQAIAARMGADDDADEITPEMRAVRARTLDERKALYFKERIEDQRHWYRAKAISSRRASERWTAICVAIYVGAVASVIIRAAWPDWLYSPTEVFIILASALLGWIQMKKFSELAATYTMAAHQAGFMDGPLDEADSEEDFAGVVKDAEAYFSREQSDWAAQGYG